MHYLYGDHLGSTSMTLNAAGQVVAQRRYEAYGQGRWSSGEEQTDFRFNSHREESEFGLYDYKARYFSPLIGRFISADTIVPDYSNPQDLNRYAYVYNNPLKFTDPSGHCGQASGGAVLTSGCGGGGGISHQAAKVIVEAAALGSSYLAANQFDLEVDLDLNLNRPSSGAPIEVSSTDIFVLEYPTDAAAYQTVTFDTPEIPLFLPFPSDPPEILQEANAPASDSSHLEFPTYLTISSLNQINQEIQRGKAPSGIGRADVPRIPHELPHIHINGGALNNDETWKHLPNRPLNNKQKKWLRKHGWPLLKQDGQ